MGERVVNGSFADGLDGWAPSSECPSEIWDCTVEGDPYPDGPVCCILTSMEGGCTSRIDQSVDLTLVPKITFTAKMYPGLWSDWPGWVKVYIDDQVVYEATDDIDDYSSFEIIITGWTGTHILSFRVRGDEVGAQIRFKNVSAIGPDLPPAPVANFTAMATTGETPFACEFVDLSTNTPIYWIWDFGDGWTLGTQYPIHIYKTAGTYTVSLTAQNDSGYDTKTKVDFIVVVWNT